MIRKKVISNRGMPQQSGLETYMSITVVTGATIGTTTDAALTKSLPTTGTAVTSVSKTTDSFVNEITTDAVACEACGEYEFLIDAAGSTATAVTGVSSGTGTFVTGVNTEDDTFVTGVTLTKTTEEILIPIVMTDNLGNAHIVLRDVQPEYPITNSSPPSA